jgi:hypothetical protein
MTKSTMPKLVILNPKGQKIIHVLSPTIKTTRQARKYMEKTKPTAQQQPSEQGQEEAASGTIKKDNGEMQWRLAAQWKWQDKVTMGVVLRGTKREKSSKPK